MIKGNYIYYGYKITENEMINKFMNDNDFIDYFNDILTKDSEYFQSKKLSINVTAELITHEHVDIGKAIIQQYFDEDCFGHNIHSICNPCCPYNTDSDWIIGIKLCHSKAFKENIQSINMYLPTKKDSIKLKKVGKKYNIDSNSLGYYSINSDCWSCS